MQIKASELRIGNIIIGRIGHTVDVTSDILTRLETGAPFGYDGIPLTEEWLSKFDLDIVSFADFGFTTKSHGHEYVIEQQDDWFFIGIRLDSTQTTYFAWNIYYVHQLQNLFQSLTGKELTIKPQ